MYPKPCSPIVYCELNSKTNRAPSYARGEYIPLLSYGSFI